MRRISFTVLLVAICLLPVGIGSGASAHSHAAAALDGALANTADAQAQVLEDYFSRARSIDLLTANNPAFQHFYALPGDRVAKARAGGPVLTEVNQALGYLERLYPDSIGEACFIDRAGPENARMVRGVRATPKNLSPDESGNPFFGPTFALRQGQVYQARPYESPDTKEWVISNSTLMPTTDGSKRAIVHFEVTIESFRKVAAKVANQFDISVVEARTGRVVLDSRRSQQTGAPWGRPRITGSARFCRPPAGRDRAGSGTGHWPGTTCSAAPETPTTGMWWWWRGPRSARCTGSVAGRSPWWAWRCCSWSPPACRSWPSTGCWSRPR
jgi:hypothetical protein